MSVKTLYTCEKCGLVQEVAGHGSPEQFWTVGVTANCAHYAADQFVHGKSMQVCRPCLESLGIHVSKKENAPQPKELTVEELIREIISRCSA